MLKCQTYTKHLKTQVAIAHLHYITLYYLLPWQISSSNEIKQRVFYPVVVFIHVLHPLVCAPAFTHSRKQVQLHRFSIDMGGPRKKKKKEVTFQRSGPVATEMKSSGKVECNTHTHVYTHKGSLTILSSFCQKG